MGLTEPLLVWVLTAVPWRNEACQKFGVNEQGGLEKSCVFGSIYLRLSLATEEKGGLIWAIQAGVLRLLFLGYLISQKYCFSRSWLYNLLSIL